MQRSRVLQHSAKITLECQVPESSGNRHTGHEVYTSMPSPQVCCSQLIILNQCSSAGGDLLAGARARPLSALTRRRDHPLIRVSVDIAAQLMRVSRRTVPRQATTMVQLSARTLPSGDLRVTRASTRPCRASPADCDKTDEERDRHVKITRVSRITGAIHTLDLPVTQEQMDTYSDGQLIQDAFPDLPAEYREFIVSGITPTEWDNALGCDEE